MYIVQVVLTNGEGGVKYFISNCGRSSCDKTHSHLIGKVLASEFSLVSANLLNLFYLGVISQIKTFTKQASIKYP